ncbi:amidohydrolase [Pseudonocardia sp. WMMC193]|uniref:amidohydrolase n=1 Tax=Pseudonocardia sp. WMMC193 TaxID=2911965 RepID=UPI001F0007CA|nr:amidohydrolase [Pseudonocardia sp. WMMC193]MCF7547541.1 amidohydrolase [Pseudonocardia sp. WMMC193]
MSADLLLRRVRPHGAPETDVLVRAGRIAATGPDLDAPGVPVEDGGGALLLPGFVDAHCHVDKTYWGRWVPNTAGPTLAERIDNERARRDELGLPSVEAIGGLLDRMVERGTAAIRTHTSIDPEVGLRGVEAVRAAAATRTLRVEQVAFPQSGMLARPGTLELMERAVAGGVETVGGLDPASYDRDPVRALDAVFDIAARHGCGVDVHLHDTGTLGTWQVELVVERTRALTMAGRVTVSHAFGFCGADAADQDRLVELLAEAGVAIATAAVYDRPVPPLVRMAAAGAAVALGNDGIRDLWAPYGDGDMLDRAHQLATRSALRSDPEITLALHAATAGGARVLGLADHGLDVGCRADLVLVDAAVPAEAVVARPPRRLVVHGGRVVARSGP